MATYVKIKAEDINLSGVTSKGYEISRKGMITYVRWGAVKTTKRKFYWAGKNLPQEKITQHNSVEDAIWYFKDKKRRINNQDYNLLPSGTRILLNTSHYE